jgi:hypothetical protein
MGGGGGGEQRGLIWRARRSRAGRKQRGRRQGSCPTNGRRLPFGFAQGEQLCATKRPAAVGVIYSASFRWYNSAVVGG